MIPKKNRANKRTLEEVFKKGRVIYSPNLVFRFLFSKKEKPPRISFIISKTVGKKSSVRAKLRRRGYSALRQHLSILPKGVNMIFLPRMTTQNSFDPQPDSS